MKIIGKFDPSNAVSDAPQALLGVNLIKTLRDVRSNLTEA